MLNWLSNLFLAFARKLLYMLVHTTVLPEDLKQLQLDPDKPVCYVLQTRFLSSLLVMEAETRKAGLPRAMKPMLSPHLRENRSVFFLTRSDNPSALQRNRFAYSPRFIRLVEAVRANPQLDVQLVPVTILWGRSPDKESSIFKILFADSWATPGMLKQFITILLHGRQTYVKFSPPVSVRGIVEENLSEEITLRKLARVLRVHFRRQREMAMGPDLSHRRTLVKSLLKATPVQQAITDEVADKKITREKATERAHQYADEIAADYSYPVIRIFDIVLTWLWTRLYDGVDVHHFDDVRDAAHAHEIVYVPCHRSHIDYLLLSYVLLHRGLMTPHIAAGANLNMPVVGSLLRRAGAFFLRRSFKGNFLYAAVFNEYLHLITAKGYPMEYFIEGGRSRTGRLLSPRTGMLAMTLRSYLRDHKRPIVFIPAYIGYEKLMEGQTYVGELSGKAKKKESIWGVISTVRRIKKTFGKVQLSFGEPIYLENLLDAEFEAWRETPVPEDGKTPWISSTINKLAQQINTNINSAAAVNPVNLLSLVLLSTPKHAMDEEGLAKQIDLYRRLLTAVPYSDRIELTELHGQEIIAYGEQLKILRRIRHPLGDMICLDDEQALQLTYFRNNVLHLFTLPSLIACLMQQSGELHRAQVVQLVRNIYPFIQSELFLPWCNESVEKVILQWLDALAESGLLIARSSEQMICPSPNSEAYAELSVLAQGVQQNLERYYMTVSLLSQQGSGRITKKRLEDLCHLLAQRLSILHEFSAPEYSDKSLFRNFVETLINTGQVQTDDKDCLRFDHRLINIAGESRLILDAETRQTIQQITRVTDAEIEAALTEKDSKGKRKEKPAA
ncbi:MAG: glycerol-3-phosphate 1-O-acyltransferase PlsB [bacterium]|nr:glycerol-3-phosphate 1-O-acyltransferase PlsB [bacterium]